MWRKFRHCVCTTTCICSLIFTYLSLPQLRALSQFKRFAIWGTKRFYVSSSLAPLSLSCDRWKKNSETWSFGRPASMIHTHSNSIITKAMRKKWTVNCKLGKQTPLFYVLCQISTSNITISIVKPTRCTSVSNKFYFDTLHVSDGLSVNHQEFKTVHTATGICQTDTAVCLLAGTCSTAVSVQQMPVAACTVSWWWTERPSETCRVSF